MKFLAVVCLLVVTLTARESLAQDGTSAIISAGLNLAGGIVQGLNRKFLNFTSYQRTNVIKISRINLPKGFECI